MFLAPKDGFMKKGKPTRPSQEARANREVPGVSPQQVLPLLDNNETEQQLINRPLLRSAVESIRNGWLPRDGKRLKAIERILRQVDPDLLDTLPPIAIFAPAIDVAGCVHLRKPNGLVVYLSPTLEFESQKRVNFTVAHEIAHMVLQHHVPGNEQFLQQADEYEERPCEVAADALAEKWGFKDMKRPSIFIGLLKHCSATTLKHVGRLMERTGR